MSKETFVVFLLQFKMPYSKEMMVVRLWTLTVGAIPPLESLMKQEMGIPKRAQLWRSFSTTPLIVSQASSSSSRNSGNISSLVTNFSSTTEAVTSLSVGPGAELPSDLESRMWDRLPLHLVACHTRKFFQKREKKKGLESTSSLGLDVSGRRLFQHLL